MNYFIVDAGEMTELLVAYFVKFGDKPCCGGDLKLYLPILDAPEADKFFVQTLNSINFDETKDDTNNPLPKTVSISLTELNILHFAFYISSFQKILRKLSK